MPRLIVTLTTIPERISAVPVVIEALFCQTLKPDMIVLYLGYDKFENREQNLPKELLDQRERGLSIYWVKDVGCFTGLIPALIDFPDDIIINIDDDINYNKRFIEELYYSYKKNPCAIHTHAANRILFDFDDNIFPYLNWLSVADFFQNGICFCIIRFLINVKRFIKSLIKPNTVYTHSIFDSMKINTPSFHNFIISTYGTLYPPHCMHDDVKNVNLAFELCPKNDDIWFWAQAIRKETKIQIAKHGRNRPDVITGTQEHGLFHSNWEIKDIVNGRKQSYNDLQLKKVLDYFPDVRENLNKESLSYSIKIKKIYLFGFIPLLNIFHYGKDKIVIALFDIILLLVIKK